MSMRLTKGDENAFCGARLQACRVDSRVDVLPFFEVRREINAFLPIQGSGR
jgi:hypothetical protein